MSDLFLGLQFVAPFYLYYGFMAILEIHLNDHVAQDLKNITNLNFKYLEYPLLSFINYC